jgi:hypothetical protein
MITITTGTNIEDRGLIKSLRCLADLLEKGCYPGEEVQEAQHIAAKIITRFRLKPYEVKFKLRLTDGWGGKIKASK